MKSARMDIRAAAWATPALRPRGRDGIFSGLMQYDAGMPDAKANGRGGQRGTASQATQQTKRRNSAGLKTREQDEEKGWQEGRRAKEGYRNSPTLRERGGVGDPPNLADAKKDAG